MIGGWRRVLLVLTLIVGVLGMHALVLVPTACAACAEGSPPATAAPTPAHDGPSPMLVGPHNPAAMTAAAMVVQSVAEHPEHAADPRHGADHGSMPSSMHQVLHLCLAILAALLVLGMAALALWPTRRPDHQGISLGALVRRVPRRPPPTSVRLAQLCVLRT